MQSFPIKENSTVNLKYASGRGIVLLITFDVYPRSLVWPKRCDQLFFLSLFFWSVLTTKYRSGLNNLVAVCVWCLLSSAAWFSCWPKRYFLIADLAEEAIPTDPDYVSAAIDSFMMWPKNKTDHWDGTHGLTPEVWRRQALAEIMLEGRFLCLSIVICDQPNNSF